MAIRSGPVDPDPDDPSSTQEMAKSIEKTLKAVRKIRKAAGEEQTKVRTLTFDRIRLMFNAEQYALRETTDARCADRVGSLVRRLKCCRIESIVGADSGAWVFCGPPMSVIWSDGSTTKLPIQALHELFEWLRKYSSYKDFVVDGHWIPIGFDASQFNIFAELAELLPWWLEETGGCDVHI